MKAVDTSWFDDFEAGFEAVFAEMNDEHLRMKFALNMICEICRRDSSLEMGSLHQMALFGLGYSHEEADSVEEAAEVA